MIPLRTVFLLALALLPASTHAQTNTTLFEPAHLREDLSILRSALEDGHVGLYRYTDKATMDAAFDAAMNGIDAPMSEPQFLSRIARVLSPIRDDHTFALPSRGFWNERIAAASTQPIPVPVMNVLPFYVKVIGDQMFVTHDNTREGKLTRGAQVISINGRSSTEILSTLDAYLPTSGSSTTYRRRHLEQYNLNQEFNFLCIYYALFIEAPDTFMLSLRNPGAESTESLVVSALPYPRVVANFRNRYEPAKDRLFLQSRPMELTWLDEGTAVLRLSSFHDWLWNRNNLKYQADIAAVFRELKDKRASSLIIDLRGNEGGSAGIAIEFLAHSVNRPFQVYDYKEMKGYRFPKYERYMRDPAVLNHFTDALFERMANGSYRIKTSLPDETWSRPMNPSQPTYDGKLYVLIDGTTGSAAAQLATLLRVNRRDAIFIGEESGGDMEGPISGSYIDLRLPRTGIRVDVPLLKKVMHLDGYPSQRGRGVIPDHPVDWTAKDIVDGNDPDLAAARKLIAR